MLKYKVLPRLVVPVVLIGLLMVVGAGLVWAGRSDNGEQGRENPIDDSLGVSDEEVNGLGSDQGQGNFLSDGEGRPETGFPVFFEDEVELVEDSNPALVDVFQRIAGSNFQPRDSTATFSYYGGGCIQRNSNTGDSWFTVDLQVPDGALLDFLRVYYYDNNASYDINTELWAFDGAGGTNQIAEADSSGTPGYSSTGSDFFDHTVDNLNESLVVVASIQGGVGSSLALCGIRVRYQYPLLSTNYLPSVLDQSAP